MSIQLAMEPLKIKSGQQCREEVRLSLTGKDLMDFLQQHNVAEAMAVFWQINKIVWAKWNGSQFILPGDGNLQPNLWQELRVFNNDVELKLRACEGALKGRFLDERDNDGAPCEYVDSLSRLWGKTVAAEGDWLMLEDKSRKLKMQIPAVAEKAQFYGLVTRNYIGVNQNTAQAGYADYRYVKICAADTELEGEL